MTATLRQDIPEANRKVSDRYLMGMLGEFLRPYWWQFLLVLLLLVAVSAISLLPPYLIQRAVDGPISTGDLNGLLPFAIIYLVIIPVSFVLRFIQTYVLQTIGQNALVGLRQKLFEHILNQDMNFFNKTPVGQLVARLSNDIEALTELLSTSIVIVISNLFTLAGIIIVMFLLNWRLALISLAVLPIMAVITFYFRGKIREATRDFHRVIGEYQAFINEQCSGMMIVQLFGRQTISRQEFESINAEYRSLHIKVRDLYTVFSSFLQLLSAVGLAVVLYGGGQGVLVGWATLGMLISFIQYTQQSFVPVLQLSEQFTQIQSAFSAGERIARMLQTKPTILDPAQPVEVAGRLDRSITFEHVRFEYEPDVPVIRGIDIHIPEGQNVAIVGATGAGKTSLAGLIARFYDVTGGRVCIGGVDVREMSLAQLRQHVMVVPQAPYCFNGSIADNLCLFDPSITPQQMREAAEAASAAPFIEKLPGGYAYELLPGGSNLSQGQRQLLALARALLHNPDSIMVLDEATSNIDTETEALIQEALRRMLHSRTSLVIAHRLSTVREADRILVMKDGQVMEDGDHDDLMAQGGMYAMLVQQQFEAS